ncbi:MAG: Uma2 family endonuclease [Anaerolineae bacterium]|nr:Uma2 family endonuclease [Anaerolineae bacterium]
MITDKPNLREGMSLDDFLELSHDQPFELIDGEKIDKMPPGLKHQLVLRKIRRLLEDFAMFDNQLGEVFSENAFIIEARRDWVKGSRTPDISFYVKSRIEGYIADIPRVVPIVPDLIIEIISPTDRYDDIQLRTLFDLDNGAKVIWIIDPESRSAWVYTSDTTRPQRFGEDGVLSAPDILPNFSLELSKVWA